MYCVIMENAALVPLKPLSDPPIGGLDSKEFDTEQEAFDFSKSIRNNWNHVYIKNTKTNEQVGEFYGDDMYLKDKRISLKKNE